MKKLRLGNSCIYASNSRALVVLQTHLGALLVPAMQTVRFNLIENFPFYYYHDFEIIAFRSMYVKDTFWGYSGS